MDDECVCVCNDGDDEGEDERKKKTFNKYRSNKVAITGDSQSQKEVLISPSLSLLYLPPCYSYFMYMQVYA